MGKLERMESQLVEVDKAMTDYEHRLGKVPTRDQIKEDTARTIDNAFDKNVAAAAKRVFWVAVASATAGALAWFGGHFRSLS